MKNWFKATECIKIDKQKYFLLTVTFHGKSKIYQNTVRFTETSKICKECVGFNDTSHYFDSDVHAVNV